MTVRSRLRPLTTALLALALCLMVSAAAGVEETVLGQMADPAGLPIMEDIGKWWAFSPADGGRLAYVATAGFGRCVVIDGKRGPNYDGIGPGSLAFSADGRRVTYAAQKGSRQVVVVDGQDGRWYRLIGTIPPASVLTGGG